MKRAFTLIELLIVIAIIAILALIAVPNFLEAQVRAKVSAAHANMRSIAVGLEAYAVDWGAYPYACRGFAINQNPLSLRMAPITSPVAYMSNIPADPFRSNQHGNSPGGHEKDDTFDYYDTGCVYKIDGTTNQKALKYLYGRKWRMVSAGPDMKQTFGFLNKNCNPYDATNGTLSEGDLILVQGGGNGWWQEWLPGATKPSYW